MARPPCVVVFLERHQCEAMTEWSARAVEEFLAKGDLKQVKLWTQTLERFQTAWKAYHEVPR